jgi:hypothetical protein
MKKAILVRSLSVCLLVLVLMAGAVSVLLGEDGQDDFTEGKVEAISYEQEIVQLEAASQDVASEEEATEEEFLAEEDANEPEEVTEEAPEEDNTIIPVEVENTSESVIPVTEKAEVSPVVETAVEQPAASPGIAAEPVLEPEKVITSAPASLSLGASKAYTFRTEVRITNNGSDTSKNIMVSVPLLENNSSYQTTSLKSANYDIVSTSGRVSTFNLGDLAPGESKTIVTEFSINVSTVTLNSSNDTIEKARQAYNLYAGDGNCRDLARAFIRKVNEQGINAREVIGYARPQRGAMTAGSLEGSRHSWAEFYVEGLGWVPVDLTFRYFGTIPHTSHLVESYSDQSIKVNFTGGNLSANWSNSVH